MNNEVRANKETHGTVKWLSVAPSAKQANVDRLSTSTCGCAEVSLPRAIQKAHRAFTPACTTAAFSQGPKSLHLLPPPFPIPFHPSCPSAFCSLARTVIKPSACGQGRGPPPPPPLPSSFSNPEKATNRLNYERNEGQRHKEGSWVWTTVIKTVPCAVTELRRNGLNRERGREGGGGGKIFFTLFGKTLMLVVLVLVKDGSAGRVQEWALTENTCGEFHP